MNYYNEIKNKIIDNEIYCRTKDYSKERNKVLTYFEIGELLYEAGSKYGESIIDNYSKRLVFEIGKKYSARLLRRMRQFYIVFEKQKWSTLSTKLSWSHYSELLLIEKDYEKIKYYLSISIKNNLSVRELRNKIKNREYERLDEKSKQKLIEKEKLEIEDFIKNPILIRNSYNYKEISEKTLKRLILEDIENFLTELGEGFTFIKSEYKIKIGNYIDLLLYNIKYNCYVVVELKVTELKKEHIGQIQTYMNYIDKNMKNINQEKTIGIVIVKKNNKFIMEYCSDNKIFETSFNLV